MRIENWSIVALEVSPYTAPEALSKGLAGRVYGSEKFEDGTNITTSEIQLVTDGGPDGVYVSTKNSTYLLGAVDPAYEAAFPGALERLTTVCAQWESE